MPNTYRKLCADAIERNSGYSRGYHERCALEWNVAVSANKSRFDELYPLALQRLREDYGVTEPAWTAAALHQIKRDWDRGMDGDGRNYYSIIEDMRMGVTDADSYRTLRPEIAARYGLSYYRFPRKYVKVTSDDVCYYPARKQGWKLEDPYTVPMFDVSWEFHGRGGKHLCLTEFEGRSLEHSSEDLAEMIRNPDNAANYSNEWCQKLLAFIHECDLCFTHQAVEQEWEYQASYRLAQELNDAHEEGDENELGLEELTEPSIIEGTVYITAKIKGVDDPDEADESVFQLDIDPERMPERKALLLASIFKRAVEAHIAEHG